MWKMERFAKVPSKIAQVIVSTHHHSVCRPLWLACSDTEPFLNTGTFADSLVSHLPSALFRYPQHQKPNSASPEVPEVDEPMVSTSRTGSAPANKTFLRKGTLNRRVSEKAIEAHKHRCGQQLWVEQRA